MSSARCRVTYWPKANTWDATRADPPALPAILRFRSSRPVSPPFWRRPSPWYVETKGKIFCRETAAACACSKVDSCFPSSDRRYARLSARCELFLLKYRRATALVAQDSFLQNLPVCGISADFSFPSPIRPSFFCFAPQFTAFLQRSCLRATSAAPFPSTMLRNAFRSGIDRSTLPIVFS